MDAHILIKCSVSKCNQELLSWLHSNICSIRKSLKLKIVIIFEDLYPKLGGRIKKLPALLLDGRVIIGNSAIKKQLSIINTSRNSAPTGTDDDLMDYWNSEMHSGVDNECTEEDDLMDQIKKRALDVSMSRRDGMKQKPKRRETIVSSARQDNVKLDNIKSDKISNMVHDDPMMQKFWENQETSPGFD